MAELIEGLVFPESQPVAGEATQSTDLFDVDARTNLAVEAFRDLGMVTDEGLARQWIAGKMYAYHDSLVDDGYTSGDSLEVFQSIDLPGETKQGSAFRSLLAAFDRKQEIASYRYEPLWEQYGSGELNRRDFGGVLGRVAPESNNVFSETVAMQTSTDYDSEPGLRFVDQNLKAQIKSAKAEQKDYDETHDGTELLMVNPADYVVINAQRRTEGKPLLDRETFSRFVQLTMKSADGYSWVPGAYSRDGRLKFGRSRVLADSFVGVRFLVGPKSEAS